MARLVRDRINIMMVAIVALCSLAIVNTASSQGAKSDKYYLPSDRKWTAELPLWIPGFKGQLAYGDFDVTSGDRDDRNRSRIQNDVDLEFYFVGRFSYLHRRLWFQLDAFAGQVGNVFKFVPSAGKPEDELVDVSISGAIPRLLGGYTAIESKPEATVGFKLIPYIGIRYTVLQVTSRGTENTEPLDVRPKWVEPVIGLYTPIYYKRFKAELQVDFGTVGTKHSWVLSNRYNYRVSKLVDLQIGWNFINIAHDDEVNGEVLKARIRLFGPSAGIGFLF